ncbi:ran guanine nucleotide release factor [Spinachia spinachia]
MQAAGGGGGARPLFGGALSAVLPPGARDASELREVPDNQEVFAHPHSDQSVIVELLEYQGQVADRDAARYHFEDIASGNEALEPGSVEVTGAVQLSGSEVSLTDCSSAWTLTGTQRVSKFNEQARNTVRLHLGLFRLARFSTDVLVTFNDPQSSSAAAGGARGPWTVQDFRVLLQTLSLHDPALFG